MLRQDPTNEDYDYAFDLKEKEFEHASGRLVFAATKSFADEDEFKWVQWLLSGGIFIGVALTIVMHFSLESSWTAVLLFHASIMASGVVLFRRKLFLSGYTSVVTFIMFLLFGWLPVIAGTGLLLNRVVPIYTFEVVDEVCLLYTSPSPRD